MQGLSYHWLSAFIGITFGVIIIVLIRRDFLHVRYSFFWVLVALSMVLIGIFPTLTDVVASWFNVGYPPVILIVVAIGVIFVKLLLMDIKRSSNERKLAMLAQEIAVLESNNKDR